MGLLLFPSPLVPLSFPKLLFEQGNHPFPGAFVGFLVVAEAWHAPFVGFGDREAVLGAGVVVDLVIDVCVLERLAELRDRLLRRE